jgi:hypothetical protein
VSILAMLGADLPQHMPFCDCAKQKCLAYACAVPPGVLTQLLTLLSVTGVQDECTMVQSLQASMHADTCITTHTRPQQCIVH